jgi:hypothetical protein
MRTPGVGQRRQLNIRKTRKLHNSNRARFNLQRVSQPAGTIHQYLAKLQNISKQGGTK